MSNLVEITRTANAYREMGDFLMAKSQKAKSTNNLEQYDFMERAKAYYAKALDIEFNEEDKLQALNIEALKPIERKNAVSRDEILDVVRGASCSSA